MGVAAIVSLQNLTLSIDDSITTDVRLIQQGDIVVSNDDRPFTASQRRALDSLASEGRFLEWTYFLLPNPDRPSFVAPLDESKERALQGLQPYLIEPGLYPLYGELNSVKPKNLPMDRLLTSPGDIVLSEGVADRLGVAVGDEVLLENSDSFVVKGLVANEAAGGVFAPYFVPPMPWFAYLDLRDLKARAAFKAGEEEASLLFIKTRSDADTEDLARTIRTQSSLDVETAAERLPDLERASDVMGKVIMVVGLVSLAIGGIGILNTMLVVVGRRTAEVAVLKALGFRGRQVILLFLVEGAMLGVAGSLAGIAVGILLSYGLTGFSEGFLQSEVPWKFHVVPVFTGLIVGIIATTVFGFLPIMAASRVRPNVVLQPQASVLPRAGRLVSLAVMVALVAVLGLVASWFLGNFVVGMAAAYGALIVLLLLTLVLLAVVWVVGRWPTFGSVNLKLSLRGLSRQKGRAASTLLALVVGLFAMGAIVILTDSMKKLVDHFVEEESGGNLFVFVPAGDRDLRDTAFEKISSLDSATGYIELDEYLVDSLSVNGRPIRRDQVEELLDWRTLLLITRGGTPVSGSLEMAEGRHLTPQDVGQPVVVVGPARPWLHVGDELTFGIAGRQVSLEIVGVTLKGIPLEEEFFTEGGNFIAPLGAVDSAIRPDNFGFAVTVPPLEATAIAARLNRELPGVITLETESVASVFKEVLDKFTVFPTILSGLALFAGAVIIANSVALATIERRREIAMMKAVGARGSRVLTSLLIENGILGVLGGAIGVGLSIGILAIFKALEPEIPVTPEPLSIILVLAVAIGVSLGAALLSAWPASRERPLAVLRYE